MRTKYIATLAALLASIFAVNLAQAVSIETIVFDDGYGITTSVTFDGTKTYTADEGASVSFTAVGDNFECWFDGSGAKIGTDRTLTFTATADTTIIPFFGKVPWKYTQSSLSSGMSYGTIANMYGALKVDWKTKDNMTFSAKSTSVSAATFSLVPILDLTGPITYNGDACAIKRSSYKAGPAWPTGLTEYRLPPQFSSTHTSTGGMSYGSFGNRHVKIVIADDNVITVLGSSAFSSNQGLAGDYVFMNLSTLGSMAFQSTRISSCVLGAGVKEVGDRAFKSCSELTNLVCLSTDQLAFKNGATPTNLQKYPVYGCSKLTDYTFHCVPTFDADWNKSAKKNREVRFHVPKSGTGWDDIIASADFEKWSASSAEDKAAYRAAFPNGPTPVGYYTGTNVGAWIIQPNTDTGLKVIIR